MNESPKEDIDRRRKKAAEAMRTLIDLALDHPGWCTSPVAETIGICAITVAREERELLKICARGRE